MIASKKINVILDLDETLFTYGSTADWEAVPSEQRDKYEVEQTRSGVFVLRPQLVRFLEFLRDNAKSVNIWTWSDKEYADGVKKMLERRVSGLRIANVWYDEHADEAKAMSGNNKDLNYIWYTKKKFSPCDTVLVDDLRDNTQNGANYQNGIRVPAFDVMGEKLGKEKRKGTKKIREGYSRDLSGDEILLEVIKVIERVSAVSSLCENEEAPPFDDVEHVGGGGRRKTRRHRRRHRGKTLKRNKSGILGGRKQ